MKNEVKLEDDGEGSRIFELIPEEENTQERKTLISTKGSFYHDLSDLSWVVGLTLGAKKFGISKREKAKFLQLFSKLELMRKNIQLKMTELNQNQHKCKVCGCEFETGRKLGGHMSRKHPGYSFEYLVKKEVHKTKIFERNRRKYFKGKKSKREKILFKE